MDLPTYFILPLTGLNFKDFGRSVNSEWNLKSTKINLKDKTIICEVKNIMKVPKSMVHDKNFVRVIKPNSLVLNIPESINLTLLHFKNGQYSRFSSKIKKWLLKYSGLPGTHNYMLALTKAGSIKLKERLEKDLGVTLPSGAELLEAPKEEWFIVQEKEEA